MHLNHVINLLNTFCFEYALIFRFICSTTSDIPHFFQSVFPRQISSLYYEESAQNDPKRCLINSPRFTMRHPIIDFDVKGNCDMIIDAAKDPPDNRWKELVAVVRLLIDDQVIVGRRLLP